MGTTACWLSPSRRRAFPLLVAFLLACGGGDGSSAPPGPTDPVPVPATRGYRMGFSAFPPRPALEEGIRSLEAWAPRADAAIIQQSIPWTPLLAGADSDSLADALLSGLVTFYRDRALTLVLVLDPTDGLSRGEEAPDLRTAGRSVVEPEVQEAYRRFGRSVASRFRPDHFGLAAETNLIRALAPAPVYQAVVRMAGDLAREVEPLLGPGTTRFVSVQVETAWGRLAGDGTFRGVDTDLADFPFITALGLSAYPFFVWPAPEALPPDYFARLPGGRPLPLLLVEGGWSNAPVVGISSSPDQQARYLRRWAQLLDRAGVVVAAQLNFTDIDLPAFGEDPATSLALPFSRLGLVDPDLQPYPALAVWDSLFALPRRP